MLANPAMGWQKVADWGIGQEREIFQTSPDKVCAFHYRLRSQYGSNC
jgi:hypothetical protein